MSRIKKALEKAKARGLAAGRREGLRHEHGEKTDEPSGLRYVQTKVVEVPEEVFIRNKIVSIQEDHPVADQFKLLRTRILQRTRKAGENTIQISGFDAGEGKSMVAMNLAVSMAKDTRQTTLLVDVDFRRPTIHRLMGLPDDTTGLKQYFEGRASLEEIFINPGINKLTVLPAGGTISHATEIVGSSKMEALVQELKSRYPDRYIIFDSPGFNVCPDPVVFSEYVDALLLVARSDFTSADSIKAAIKLVPKDKLLGTVLNDSKWQEPMAYHEHY